jgi:guanylate kinase
VISGPSGSGKTTLLKGLLKHKALRGKVIKSVSLTTRLPRQGEKNRKDYFFVTREEFRRKLRAKKILEWTKYLGYYYATPLDFVKTQLKKGKNVLLCLDLKGALKIRRLYPKNTVLIFILPPSLEALRERIAGRCRKTKKEEIGARLKQAKKEFLALKKYDYSIINKNLSQAARELKEIVLKEINTQ